ncbi:MAG: 23S rRNA (uracil(1939)-C(5))-methyltransferase RlmD [Candidatus Limivivens sp.]|nr:23S rRNA (uracil(1939)-C(5))-methyltransferase RlmD [Candidatus Limivivens sp.]
MKKDDIVRLKIEDMSAEGSGIGKLEGFALFVKDAIIGDEVEAKIMKMKKNYGYARLLRILSPSADRTETPCPVARQCGGCQIQAMNYQAQLRFKENKIFNNLQRIGGFDRAFLESIREPFIGMEDPWRYRNKAQFPVGKNRDGRTVTGFYAGRTHTIIENRNCLLGREVNEEVLNAVLDWMERSGAQPYDEETGKGLVRHILIRCGFTTQEVMVCLVINGKEIPKPELLVEKLKNISGMTSITLNVNRERTNVILGRQILPLWGKTYIEDCIGDIRYQISPLSFFQVNPVQTRKLYSKALEYAGLTGKETVWDLYCGIGTISLFLAGAAAKVYGVEIVPAAIEDARRNAALNGIENVEFFVGKAEEVFPEKFAREKISADVVVVDPPRKGCEENLLETIVEMAPERIVYVSCDSATLARDLKFLCEKGYELRRWCGTDQFPMSVHVETVCLLSRK